MDYFAFSDKEAAEKKEGGRATGLRRGDMLHSRLPQINNLEYRV